MNLPVTFAALLAGAALLDAGAKGDTIANVIQGKAKMQQSTGSASPSSGGGAPGSGSVLASLFPSGIHPNLNRHDQGRDLSVPAGTDVLAPGSGTVLRIGVDPSGFGSSYPIVHFNDGPWAGLDIYIGHVKSLLSAGQSFKAGDPLGQTQNGSGPYAGNASTPGWAEIGLAPGGNPGGFGQTLPPGL